MKFTKVRACVRACVCLCACVRAFVRDGGGVKLQIVLGSRRTSTRRGQLVPGKREEGGGGEVPNPNKHVRIGN